ncbi:hypothetical protein JCM33374_g6605 [Metschnikowia sp. JCM 33374]|nr:hypothetical protein JCM33374_g6605 [Metschnikowia sp. JCM 33374]
MSLINNAIEAMGSQNHPNAANFHPRHQTSVGWWTSVKDWWSVSSALQKPTEKAVHTPQFAAARAQNVKIEYDLFRAVLSPDVYIYPPVANAHEKDEPLATSHAITARFLDTTLADGPVPGACFIHEFELTHAPDLTVPRRHLVLIHGYMAAMGYFVKNLEAIAKSYPNLVVHVLDMPGFGNSARPAFPASLLRLPKGASRADEIRQIIDVENWFIDKIELWRIAKNLAHFDLVGHSMGAYVSSCYLLKYNKPPAKIVHSFMLVSPMGTESSDISLINDKSLQFNHHDVASNPLDEIFATSASCDQQLSHNDDASLSLWKRLGKPKFPRNAVLRALWNNHISPFQLLQLSGPFYSKLLSFWSFQRFQHLSANTVKSAKSTEAAQSTDSATATATATASADPTNPSSEDDNVNLILKLHEYSFSIFNQYQASGELAITKFINHEIVPRLPLCDRGFVEYLNDANIRTLWMYGDKDWMNSKGGEYCVEKLQGLSSPATEHVTISNAGHHIYLDNPEDFNNAVIDFFEYMH